MKTTYRIIPIKNSPVVTCGICGHKATRPMLLISQLESDNGKVTYSGYSYHTLDIVGHSNCLKSNIVHDVR